MIDELFWWAEAQCLNHYDGQEVLLGDHRLVQRESGRVEEIWICDRRGADYKAIASVGPQRFTRYFTERYLLTRTIALLGNVLALPPVIFAARDRLILPTQEIFLQTHPS